MSGPMILVPRPEPAPSLEAVRAYLVAHKWKPAGADDRTERWALEICRPNIESYFTVLRREGTLTLSPFWAISQVEGRTVAEVVDEVRTFEPGRVK